MLNTSNTQFHVLLGVSFVLTSLAMLVRANDDSTSSSSGASVKVVYVEKDGTTRVEDYDYLFSSAFTQLICHLVSFILPAYASFKAIRSPQSNDDKHWLIYWIIYALIHVFEYYLLVIVVFIPFYWEIKFFFIIWLIAPQTRGATLLYVKYVEPFLNKHEQEIDEQVSNVQKRASVAVQGLAKQVVHSVISGSFEQKEK
ncbi:hypothetical protein FDP41_000275 [Naegleria fowleri]|uniref:Receptor expression-enhancing protein n=1 Tax=Naegleria fowleri TaxID=5763 RepID=A0A6A5CBY8_NAEFO|nr:uncharacterized protein FDP41_012621 [Naegleria fowleri]XP_044569949.1 uncharacterized protein FDP41_000275 [Naegleria fowleri]KAF0981361.1 hypothetical protein FDP41_012621 [Naegleria fowleri]KAF0985236.1 hypothetical protein FDP41_000275 [Naegleria fowleri]CAG4710018.1 unnamed protein product [Naegleria fowleri]